MIGLAGVKTHLLLERKQFVVPSLSKDQGKFLAVIDNVVQRKSLYICFAGGIWALLHTSLLCILCGVSQCAMRMLMSAEFCFNVLNWSDLCFPLLHVFPVSD